VVKLWTHQRDALLDLVLGHWLLLWEPGTGKTAALLAASGEVGGHTLWLCPPVLIPQLLAEIRQWRRGASVQVVRNGREIIRRDRDIVVCSYDLMRRMPVWRQLYSRRWDICVADEGHAFGHSGSVRTRAFYGARDNSQGALYRKCDRVWISTGTPVLNNPDELHGHLSRLFPRLIPDLLRRADFLSRFCILQHRSYGEIVVGGRNLGELREILSCCASRLRLADVTDLPPLLEDTISVEISKADREAIEASIDPATASELHVVLTQLEGGIEAAWQRLQGMLLPLMTTRRLLALAKAEAAADLVLAELDGGADRVVLFGHHVEALKHIAARCVKHSPLLLIGETPHQARDGIIRRFTEGLPRLLIAGIRLAGTGLNLQAGRRCIFIETDWTPAGHEQAVARLYRAGQARPVHSSILAVPDSVDTRVAEVLRRKRRVINEVLGAVA
jgi:SNF2 family DNA or RNA helicase